MSRLTVSLFATGVGLGALATALYTADFSGSTLAAVAVTVLGVLVFMAAVGLAKDPQALELAEQKVQDAKSGRGLTEGKLTVDRRSVEEDAARQRLANEQNDQVAELASSGSVEPEEGFSVSGNRADRRAGQRAARKPGAPRR